MKGDHSVFSFGQDIRVRFVQEKTCFHLFTDLDSFWFRLSH